MRDQANALGTRDLDENSAEMELYYHAQIDYLYLESRIPGNN